MGIVLQDSFLFEDTIMENIRYGKPDATDEEVFAASKAVNADKFIANLPEAYGMKIEESSSNISIGQRQLISFARTLLTNPGILILDEATSSVDPYTELYIQSALKRLMENRTAIIIAHRLSTVRMADEIVVFDEGRIVEQGTHEELMAKGGLYSAFYKTQFEERIGPIS
jgi:ABC-type multidrug transport system fused ATPase/permease subunit